MGNIRYAKKLDIPFLKAIIDDAISLDYYSEEALESLIADDNSLFFVYTDENDEPIACLICEIGELKKICLKDNVPFDKEVFNNYAEDAKVIIYKTAATKKEYRNGGILTEFLNEAAIKCRDIKHDLSMCLCLVLPNGKIPVHRHVIKDGFRQVHLYKSPWNCIKSYCSYCGSEYCKCDGMLYIKEN